MINHPFSLLRQFPKLSIRFFVREDNLQTDTDLIQTLGSDHIVSLRQVHGNHVVKVQEPSMRMIDADGSITDVPGLWLSIRAADCQQLIIYAPNRHVIGVIHAGWKGLKAGVIPSFFKKLKEEWGIDPSETFVAIGPSLCMKCAEFSDPLRELEGLDPQFFDGRHANLQGIADAQLETLGIPKSQRERHLDCTKCNNEMYWSYRGENRGKIIAGYCNVMACSL